MYTHADWLVGPVDVRVVCHFQMHRPRVPTEARMCAQPWTQQIRGCRGGGEAGCGRGPLWVSPWATMRLRDCFQNSFSAGAVETAGEQVVLLNCTLYSGRGGELYVACVSHAHMRPRRLRPGPSWLLGAVGQPRDMQQGAVPEAVPLGDGARRRPRSGPRQRRGQGAVGPAEPGGWPSGSCAKGGLVGSQLGGTKNACQAPSRPGSFQIKSGSLQGGA